MLKTERINTIVCTISLYLDFKNADPFMSILFSYKTTFTNQHLAKDVVAVMFHVIKVSFKVKFIRYNNELLLTLPSIALGIAVEILFMRHEQKDCNVKPDPCGNAQNTILSLARFS